MFPLPSLRQISVNQQLLRFYLAALLLNVGFVLPAAQGSPPLLELSPQPDKLVLSWVPQPQSANFLQVSDNLVDWNYHSLTLPGSSPMRSLDFPATPGPRFFRAVSHVYAGNDPDAEDFDGDGLTTRDEILTFGTDPLVRDSNGDGVADGDGDSDMDGLPDSVEIRAGLDAHDSADSSGDLDRDGITNLTEYQTGTDPANPDTDHDGLGDAWESLHGAPLIFSDSAADEDLDGLTSLTECLLGTSPHLADTDTNGITDASEDFDLDGVSNLQEQIAGTSSLNYYDNMSVSVTLVSGNYQAISPGETTAPVIVKVTHAGASGAALANAPIFVAPTCAGTVGGISQPSTVYRTGQDGTFSFTFAAAAEALIGTSPLFIGLGSLPTGQSLARVNLEIISPISPEGAISAATYSSTLKQVGMTSSTTELAAGRAVFPVVVKLADLPMPADTVPWKINDRGQVAYLDYNLNGLLVWNGRSLVTIPQEHPGFLYVRDLNSAGKLVGELQRVVLEGFSFSRTTWAFHADIGAARLSILKPYVPDLYEFFEDQNFGTWMPFSTFNALNRSSLSHIAESGTAWGVQDGFQNIATASPFPSRKNCVTEKLDGIPASYQTYSGNWKRLPGNSSAFHKVRNGTLAIGPVGAIRVPFIISPDASHSLLSVGSSFVKIEETTGSSSYSTRSVTRLEAHPDIRLPAQLPGAVVGITDVGDIAGSTNSGTRDPYFLRNGTLVRFPVTDQVLGLANRKLSEPAMVFGKKGVWLQRTDPVTGLPQLLTKGANSFEYRTYQEFSASLALSNLSALAVSKQGNTVVLAGTNVQGLIKNVTVSLLPVEAVELSPKLRDSGNNEIARSEVPQNIPESNSMVEEAPNTNRIAHREMKVKVGSALKDKKITWTMDARFTPEGQSQPSFRGDWARAAAAHRDRFETSTAYGSHAYRRISQEQGETTVDTEGFTAIRVNVPPIGFNKARIKIQIEGTTTTIELIDLDVQAVVVIDPGHGGTPETDFVNSTWNNSTSPSGVLEKTMALSYGLELKSSLEAHALAQRINLKVLITRSTDVSLNSRNRANIARDNGADQLFIIHFNAFTDDDGVEPDRSHTVRGTLEVRQSPNLTGSLPEDIEFIDTVLDRMVPAMLPFDAGCNRRSHVIKDTTVATDTYIGNEENYHPVRAGYCEVEFIDFGKQTPTDATDDSVDILLNTGPNAGAVRTAIANAMRDGIIQDLRTQPRPTP